MYYESLCSDSIAFVVNQLYPAWDLFKDQLQIEYRPFGKANWTETEEGYEFTCQHGHEECIANMGQACLLDLFQGYDQEEIVPIISCVMAYRYPPESFGFCLWTNASPIRYVTWLDCMMDRGQDLLHAIGEETHALRPALNFVPWILFNLS